MTLHLLKLSVGTDSIDDLANWQRERAAERKKSGGSGEIFHVTRQMPKRGTELLAGGSLYWVIKGQIAVRQPIVELRPVTKTGIPHCAIVLDATLVPVFRRTHRPFQGWRYLTEKDAPRDMKASDLNALPESLRAELAALGLL